MSKFINLMNLNPINDEQRFMLAIVQRLDYICDVLGNQNGVADEIKNDVLKGQISIDEVKPTTTKNTKSTKKKTTKSKKTTKGDK